MIKVFLVTIFFAGSTFAASAKYGKVRCKVDGWDTKIVKLKCDPTNEKLTLRTPKDWLKKTDVLKPGSSIEMDVTLERLQAWSTFNKGTVK